MSANVAAGQTPLPAGVSISPGTLRAEMEDRRATGRRFTLQEAVGITVPLCTQLAGLHDAGKRLFVHPSSLDYGKAGTELLEDRAQTPPDHPRDRACLAPEERRGEAGDQRASVFTIGAILYELLTSGSVGPGMKRPREVDPNLPESLESLLGKALVADPSHRPNDLAALASALHNLCPSASQAPPPADLSHLDGDESFEVDVSLSMVPPPPEEAGMAIPKTPLASSTAGVDPTLALAELKARLEADPRPRYVVVKDGMDHGPFSAVELLQQIASGSFLGEHQLRDDISGDQRDIQDWEEFAPFAEQAKLNRDIKVEKAALEAVVVAEKKGLQYKALIGAAVVGVIGAAALGYWYRERANDAAELSVHSDEADNVDVNAALSAEKNKPGMGGPGSFNAGSGSFPVVQGGSSCEAAQANYVEEYKIGGGNGKPDLTAGAYGAVLNSGEYLNACGVPSNMAVSVCAAVQNGRAVGVTVGTDPSNPKIASCVAGRVRAMSFPAHPRLDVTRTTFAAQ